MTEETTMSKPKASSSRAQKELDRAEKQFQAFDQNIKDLTLDRMNMAPKEEVEAQTKLSTREAQNSKDIYLKPVRTIDDRQKFNEKFRAAWEFDKEYVQFIAENKEIIGEDIEIWTHPYGGVGAEFWKVPTNKPVWGPRYLAEQIKRKSYHRLVTKNTPTQIEGGVTYHGALVAETTVQRLDAHPVSQRKSLFMGSSGF